MIKKITLVSMAIFLTLILCSCSILKNQQLMIGKTQLETELSKSLKIVFINNKEVSLKFTVSDANVVEQIAAIIGRGKSVNSTPGVDADYSINFYLPSGEQKKFDYWMGASQNNKDVNFKDVQGTYRLIPESLDTYIINSTKMWQRPDNFVKLYSSCLNEAISNLEKNSNEPTTVGVDIKSDRRMRRYTMSFEEGSLLNNISVAGYTILPWSKESKFTYSITFVTNIYNPDKAQIVVEAVKSSDQTNQTFVFDTSLVNGKWVITRNKD